MLLSVAETENDVRALRKEFVAIGYFTYSATVEEMVSVCLYASPWVWQAVNLVNSFSSLSLPPSS